MFGPKARFSHATSTAGSTLIGPTATRSSGITVSITRELCVPTLLFLVCLAAQFYLVFFKSFNWDEFLHFSFIYRLRAGTLDLPFQIFHLRLLLWAPEVSRDLVQQMLAARTFMWVTNLVTLAMIYGLARQFTTVPNSFFSAFAYLTAGYVFTQAFSIRADPIVTATLTSALVLTARGPLNALKAVAIGVLIGVAGMMTFKSIFYAPCFAGLLWLKFRERPQGVQFAAKLAILLVTAVATFAAIYLYFGAGAIEPAKPVAATSQLSFYVRWVSSGVPFYSYIGTEILYAPLLLPMLVLAPYAWRKTGLTAEQKIALAGLMAPLLVLLFYRNTFPYFFVFILAPPAVAIGPALGMVRDRYGNGFLAILLSASPLALAILEPRDVIDRQRALIDYVHREFPGRPGYLDYSGMISDYPRVLTFLTSGNGIQLYHDQGKAIVGREIDRGNVPFIIANQPVILQALQGNPVPGTFLPADLAAMKGNYVQQWGVLWREGKQIPAGVQAFEFQLRRGGAFVLNGSAVSLDGVAVARGQNITLGAGRHVVEGGRNSGSTLWRGNKLPATPPNISIDDVFTTY